MQIGDYVRSVRERRGLSQLELARLSGLSPSFICLLEQNKRKDITSETVYKLTRALRIPVGDYYEHTQSEYFIIADRQKQPEEILKELSQSLPVVIPVYKNLQDKKPSTYHYIPRELIKGGIKVYGLMADRDVKNFCKEGDLLICSKNMQPNVGDYCIYEKDNDICIIQFQGKTESELSVIIELVRKFREKLV